jgi:FkbM family methyltransferase
MLRKASYYLISIIKLLNGFCETPTVLRLFLFSGLGKRYLLTLRKNHLRFYVRSAMDVWSIKETFLDNFYLPQGWFNIGKNWNIVDVGAGVGDFSLLAGSLAPEGKVIAFEAFSETFHLLQENINLNIFSNITAYHEAVGANDGYVFIEQHSAEPLQYSTRSYTAHHKDLSVKAVSLRQIFERDEIPFAIY